VFRIPILVFGVNPVDLMINDSIHRCLSKGAFEELYRKYGLVPDPDVWDWIYMFWRYIVNSFTGEFGKSFISQKPVVDEIASRLPNTLLLILSSSIVSIFLGFRNGLRKPNDVGSKKNTVINSDPRFAFVVPVFWLGMIMLMVFSFFLPTIPGGMIVFPEGGTISYEIWTLAKVESLGGLIVTGDILYHLFLPALTLGIGSYSGYFFCTRNSINNVMIEDYIPTSRAKGVNECQIVQLHSDKNALLNLIKLVSSTFGFLIGSTILVEAIFNWYGLGSYLVHSLFILDYPVIQATFIILSIVAVLAKFVADIIHDLFNPRMKF